MKVRILFQSLALDRALCHHASFGGQIARLKFVRGRAMVAETRQVAVFVVSVQSA